ncbi:MAG: transcription-repair coupling factor [candidate division WOR-3 bacterium]
METLLYHFLKLAKIKEFLAVVKKRQQLSTPPKPLITINRLNGALPILATILYRVFKENLIILIKDNETKQKLFADLSSFLPEENIICCNDINSAELEFYRFFISTTNKSNKFIVLLQLEDFQLQLPTITEWHKYHLNLNKGKPLTMSDLIVWLDASQYERTDLVTEPLEYAVRGGIVDIFPPKYENPIRIEFYGNEIVSMRTFDTITQRSISHISGVELIAQNRSDTEKKTLIELLPKDTLVLSELPTNDFNKIILIDDNNPEFKFNFFAPPIYLGRFDLLKSEIESSSSQYFFVIPHQYQYQRLTNIFGNKPNFIIGHLSSGIYAPNDNFCIITERELYGAPLPRQPKRKFKGQPLDDLLALNKGDYVVHIDYGIGQFENVVRLKIDNVEKDFLLIKYANEQKLYLPVENLSLVERYVGSDEQPPSLSTLGTNRWLLTKLKVARATEAYAQELLELYAKRSIARKEPLNKDTEWQKEFEASFGYEETPDQLKALADVKQDLESPKPMDRLICGDTGFGKTEIALRAAFKTVMNLKQVAVLVPTTILCYQHYQTFQKRFENFPVKIAMLSRFTPKRLRPIIIKELKNGKIDIIIGTHALLSSQIEFKNLGLLIIDEEHKFGVKQKEKIKKLKASIDVLTLTATPIPRTLYRALVGISDISPIHTPPAGRRDIITKVIYWDNETIYQSITDELKRGGQVLFIHNRINSIKTIARKIQQLNPDWRIAVAHSKLPEKYLAQIYADFVAKKFDILVSTAIVESGLDLPNVNTIIINRADWFGLSDLHQLRGRVGHSDKQAYAIFILPDSTKFKEPNDKQKFEKRMSTILAYSQLGVGFRLAIRDMELRGVGNILGTEQHGYINQVGLNLYQNLLKQAIAKLRGEKTPIEPTLVINIPAYIPSEYIANSYERVAIYKRLLSLESLQELTAIKAELIDRFGKYPTVVENLLTIALIRLKAIELNLLKISLKDNTITIVDSQKTVTFPGTIHDLINYLSKSTTKNF